MLAIAVPMVGSGANLENDIPMGGSTAEPSAVPTIKVNPFPTDIGEVAFIIAGVADMAVDVEVEVGTTPDFPIGSETIFTTTQDNYASGVFMIQCSGLMGDTDYYYRVALTNGADTLFYPSLTTTNIVHTGVYSTGMATLPVAQVQDRPTNANQSEFLCVWKIEIGPGHYTWPQSVITNAFGLAVFTNSIVRDELTGESYQQTGSEPNMFGAWGMWDDGTGMAFWHNETEDGVYIGNPAPFAAVKTDKYVEPVNGWDLYNGRNYITFYNNITPGWDSSNLAEDIITYINTTYSETLEKVDITVTKFDSLSGSFTKTWYITAFGIWANPFPLERGDCYIVEIMPGALSVEPRDYELPDSPLSAPVRIDIYNWLNYRGFPVTSATDSAQVIEDIITYINTNYPEYIKKANITISKYDSVSGSFLTTVYFDPLSKWVNVFPLEPGDGYIIQLSAGTLKTQPRSYTPS